MLIDEAETQTFNLINFLGKGSLQKKFVKLRLSLALSLAPVLLHSLTPDLTPDLNLT